MADYSDFLVSYFKSLHFNTLKDEKVDILADTVEKGNANKEQKNIYNNQFSLIITDKFFDWASKNNTTLLTNQKNQIRVVENLKNIMFVGVGCTPTKNSSIADAFATSLLEEANSLDPAFATMATRLRTIANGILGTPPPGTHEITAANITDIQAQYKLIANMCCVQIRTMVTNYESLPAGILSTREADFLREWRNEVDNFTPSGTFDAAYAKNFETIRNKAKVFVGAADTKFDISEDNINQLYDDLLKVFFKLGKDSKKTGLSPKLNEFYTKYNMFFPKKKMELPEAQIDALIAFFEDRTMLSGLDPYWLDRIKDIVDGLKKAKKTDRDVSSVVDAMEYFLNSNNKDLPAVVLGGYANNKEFFENLKSQVSYDEDKLRFKSSGQWVNILNDIYKSKEISDECEGTIQQAKESVKNENNFDEKLPKDKMTYKSPWQKKKEALKEIFEDNFISKFKSRHFRHSYKSTDAKNIVGVMVKSGISPDKGLGAWLNNSSKIEGELNGKDSSLQAFKKMQKFLEQLKSDDEKFFNDALSSPDRMNKLASYFIKYAGENSISNDDAKTILETFSVMRYDLFDFDNRREKMQDFWKNGELLKGLSIFKGNKGAEVVGNIVDWGAKCVFAGVVNAVALGTNVLKRTVSKTRRSGQKEINKMKGNADRRDYATTVDVNALRADLDTLMSNERTKKTDIENYESLLKNFNTADREYNKVNNEIAEKTTMINDLTTEITDLDNEITDLENEIANLSRDLAGTLVYGEKIMKEEELRNAIELKKEKERERINKSTEKVNINAEKTTLEADLPVKQATRTTAEASIRNNGFTDVGALEQNISVEKNNLLNIRNNISNKNIEISKAENVSGFGTETSRIDTLWDFWNEVSEFKASNDFIPFRGSGRAWGKLFSRE